MPARRIGVLIAVFAVHAAAHGEYLGLSVERHTTVNIAGISRDVYRMYANFDNPGDQLTFVFGSPTLGTMTLESRNSDDTGPGSNFFNVPLVGNRPPTQEMIDFNPNAMWDSFVTIGLSIADQAPYGDQILFSPGFPQLAGNSYVTDNAGWHVFPTIDHDNDPATPSIANPQSLAGFDGDGDSLLRVLMLQLTVNAGDLVRGTVVVSVRLAGDDEGFSIPNQTFASVPAPGGLALLALTLAMSSRRRRR